MDLSADVAIIGAGFAGLVAGVRASEFGFKVIVLEKGANADYPCNSRFSGGTMQIFKTSMAAEPEELVKGMLANTAGFVPPELGAAFVSDGPRALEWLRARGGMFIKIRPGEHQRWVMAPPRRGTPGLDWNGRGPDQTLRRLTERLSTNGSILLLGTRATDLIIDNGRIAGLEAVTGEQPRRISAKTVVIADGGFQANQEELKTYITRTPERLFQRNARNGTGDGLRLARRMGAKLVGMEWFYGHPLSRDAFHNDKLWPHPYLDEMCVSGIIVDKTGKRIVDEGMGPWFIANMLARRPDPLDAMVIFDEVIWTGPAADLRSPPAPNPTFRDAGGTLHVANTIEKLAPLAGLPADALTATIAAYNQAHGEKKLGDLTPRRTEMRGKAYPIVKVPFYAAPICAGITYTMGGPAVDAHCRVLNESGDVIPGLFAVGSSTGGLEGGDLIGYFGGIAKAVITGIRAAECFAGNYGAQPASTKTKA
jgi:fumarate reductase flavoprotein subunit